VNVSDAVARVYASALLRTGEAQQSLPRIVDDLRLLRELYSGDAQFRAFFTSPRVDPRVKREFLLKTFEGRLDRPVLGLLCVLVDKQREAVLDNVADWFDRFRDLREGRIHAHVTSARALEPDQRDELVSRLAAATGKQVQLHEKVEPRLLGGLVIKVGDRVLDGTLRRKLERLRRELVAAQG